ncbi:MAG: 16S rRNA processing protein RimM [Bacilli bacterium]|nr:16S rRNA processing protein RimM [Bacilli bacterium]
MEYFYIGKLVNTHALKGEVRILSNFRHKDKVFINGFKLYIGKDKKEYVIESYRKHKNFDMVIFKGYYDINLVEHLKGSMVYINKEDLKLDKNTYLAVDLIGYNAIINDKRIGVIMDVLDTKANEILVLDNKILIPYVKEFIISVDKEKKEVHVKDVKGLLS